MKDPFNTALQRSLVTRLTVLMSFGLLIIWLISVFVVTYVSLVQERKHITEDLAKISAMLVTLSNHRFEGAERDAQTLMRQYTPAQIALPNTMLTDESDSHFFTFTPDICTPEVQQNKDRSFLQRYGSAGQTYYQDSFILIWRRGITLLSPHDSSPAYFDRRTTTLREFPQHPTHDQFYWSKPEYIARNGWSVSVATADTQGVIGGMAVKLNDLIAYARPQMGTDKLIWLDQNNDVLPFSSAPKALQTQLAKAKLHDGWQQLPGYLALRTQLHGPGWQQVFLYPTNDVFPRTTRIIAHQLPFALATLTLMAATLCWLLHRYLARPLWDFVKVIESTDLESLGLRLPQERQDELGNIARAYNRLLNTLRQQYDDLESKVAERTQALNEARQQAEQASKRKSAHLTTISHELRTPLGGILGAVELLQASNLDLKQAGLADTARQCTLSLLTIINNLLDFSRIESGHFPLHIEEHVLLPLLDQAMQTIQGPAQNKKLALRTFVGPRVPLKLHTDGVRLRQILVNLLGNALKFTDAGGICLTVKRRDNQLIFSVSDSGKGIALYHQEDVFTAFFQAETDTQGAGIGLAISLNLAKMLGGKLELSSTPGLGTNVSLLLPLTTYSSPPRLTDVISAPLPLHRQLSAWGVNCELSTQQGELCHEEFRFLPGKLYHKVQQMISGPSVYTEDVIAVQPWQLQILLVDDASINREIISKMLVNLGQKVTTASSSSEALSLAQQHRFDLVLMDIRMPETDGIECVRRWRCCPGNKDPDCIIVALSANSAPEEVARCKKAGMRHYLTKPVTLATLASIISVAAEYQFLRDIPLQQQDAGTPMLASTVPAVSDEIYRSLVELLTRLENSLIGGKDTKDLLHTIKGCFGQVGLNELVCHIVDMENRVRHGLDLKVAELTELRQNLDAALLPHRPR